MAALMESLVTTSPAEAAAGRPALPSRMPAPSPSVVVPLRPDVFQSGISLAPFPDPDTWMAWSLLDRADGRRVGSANSATERTNAESAIKAWIAADYLRVAGERPGPVDPAALALIARAIESSDDLATEQLYRELGGDKVLQDLEATCQVGVTTSRRGYWSFAQVTARDAVDIFDCVLDRAPGYPAGNDLIRILRSVDRDDAFGIPEALPPGTAVAVKNGWTQHGGTDRWNVNCVASWDNYVLAVMLRYPAELPLDYGSNICRDVTRAVVAGL
jgi:hypothetical protein